MDTTRLKVDGKKLKEARGDRSPTEVAEAVGITYAQLWNIENDKSQPSSGVLLSLCTIYGRDASEFAIAAQAA
jgi:transcriptional regulator with XRE-family HTH domain